MAVPTARGSRDRKVDYICSYGTGHHPNPVFDNYSDAMAKARVECNVHSYIHPDKYRHAQVIKRTVITEILYDSRRDGRLLVSD